VLPVHEVLRARAGDREPERPPALDLRLRERGSGEAERRRPPQHVLPRHALLDFSTEDFVERTHARPSSPHHGMKPNFNGTGAEIAIPARPA
jgi:hypothetical protein